MTDLLRHRRHLDVVAGDVLEERDEIDLLLVVAAQRGPCLLTHDRDDRGVVEAGVGVKLAPRHCTPEGLKAYAEFSKLQEGTAKRALQEFLPLHAVDPDRISGIDEVMADAIAFKFISAPLSKEQLAELIQMPNRKP